MAVQIIRNVSADVVKRGTTRNIYAKQYDLNSRFLNVRIQEDGKDIIVNHNSIVTLNVKRSDGEVNTFDGVVNPDGTVTVPIPSWLLSVAGTHVCDISTISRGSVDIKLTTMQFNIIVEAAAASDEALAATEDYGLIVSLLNRVETAADQAEAAANNATQVVAACDGAAENANQAAEEARGVRAEIQAGGFIESMKEMNKGEKFTLWVGTLEEFNRLPTKVNNCYYVLTDDPVYQDVKQNKIHYVEMTDNEFAFAMYGLRKGVDEMYSEGQPVYGTPEEIANTSKLINNLIRAFFEAQGKPICIKIKTIRNVPERYLGYSSVDGDVEVYDIINVNYSVDPQMVPLNYIYFNFTHQTTNLEIVGPELVSLGLNLGEVSGYNYKAVIMRYDPATLSLQSKVTNGWLSDERSGS